MLGYCTSGMGYRKDYLLKGRNCLHDKKKQAVSRFALTRKGLKNSGTPLSDLQPSAKALGN